MANMRMAVVVRRDLQMSPGLLSAQVAHIASLFVQEAEKGRKHGKGPYSLDFSMDEVEWIRDPYIAILAVDLPEELAVVIKAAKDEKLPVREWHDVIPSKVLDGRVLQCLVGISIGPTESDTLRKITGTLPLY